jgi:hypothetical protein
MNVSTVWTGLGKKILFRAKAKLLNEITRMFSKKRAKAKPLTLCGKNMMS